MKNNFIVAAGVLVIAVTSYAHAKTCAEHGVTAGALCGGGTSVLPPMAICEDDGVSCYNTECSSGCYCIPDSSYCPSSGSTTSACSEPIRWGNVSSGLQTGLCSNNVAVYRCDKAYYYNLVAVSGAPRPPRPGSAYSTQGIDCVRCPGMIPRPGNTAATNAGAGLYEITQCYIPMNSDMTDGVGVYQFMDEDCFYAE